MGQGSDFRKRDIRPYCSRSPVQALLKMMLKAGYPWDIK